jgi:hypothetical protein
VLMLMTKTKPKKMTMVGSDGRAYTYLLKGREDLHLDERMMQLLDIVNILLLQDRPSHARGLRARSYAVIPVGPRSGLIQVLTLLALPVQKYTNTDAARCLTVGGRRHCAPLFGMCKSCT